MTMHVNTLQNEKCGGNKGMTYRGSESSGCRKYLLQTSGLLWLSAAHGLARKLRLVALEIGTDGRALLG